MFSLDAMFSKSIFDRQTTIAIVAAACLMSACSDEASDNGSDAALGDTNVIDAGDAGDTAPDTGDAGQDGADAGDASSDTPDGDLGGDADTDTSDAGGDADQDGTDGPPPDDLDPLVGEWSSDFSTPGMTGDISAQVSALYHDPSTDEVFAGGTFVVAGTTPAKNVARWDGFTWNAMGSGLDIHVNALAKDRVGDLYAGGQAVNTSANQIYRWDGTQWQAFSTVQPANSKIHDMVITKSGDIVVAGDFLSIGNVAAPNLAKLTASGWEAISTGNSPDDTVYDVEPAADGFCMVGSFTHIGQVGAWHAACWDGTKFEELGQNLPDGAKAMISIGEGEYLAGGTFDMVDDTGLHVVGLAKFDGTTWAPHAGGVGGGLVTEVRSFQRGKEGEIYVGGSFAGASATGLWSKNILRLEGADFTELNLGVAETMRWTIGATEGVNAMTVLNTGQLIVGGFFTEAPDAFAVNIALWDGDQWHAFVNTDHSYLGVSGTVWSMASGPDGEIYAAGYFRHAGRDGSPNIAKFENNRWHSLGEGIEGGVEVVAVDGNTVYAGGEFELSGANGVSYIAKWNGAEWRRMGFGLNGGVRDITIAPNGDLYVAGSFGLAGGNDAGGVAYWDGSSWNTLGAGFDGNVEAIAVAADGTVYAGGWFERRADGTPTARLARWDGTEWVEVGGGIPSGYVKDLDFYNGDLVVVGFFTTAGGVTVNSLALWDGTTFSTLGNGVIGTGPNATRGAVMEVAVKANGLFISGGFHSIGRERVENLAWWDGSAWHALGAGLPGGTGGMLIHDHSLYVGGAFTAAGGHPSYGIARWEYGQ